MIEQRALLKKLTDNPVTETAPWIVGEPSMHEVLGAPVVHAVLRRDGLGLQDLMPAVARARRRLSPSGLVIANLTAPEPPAGGKAGPRNEATAAHDTRRHSPRRRTPETRKP